jgi:hypothetical protein
LFLFFCFWNRVSLPFYLCWPWTHGLPASPSWVGEITGMYRHSRLLCSKLEILILEKCLSKCNPEITNIPVWDSSVISNMNLLWLS